MRPALPAPTGNLPPDLANLFAAMTEQAPWPLAKVDGADHVVRSANPAFCRLLHRSREMLLGVRFATLIADEPLWLQTLKRVFGTGTPETYTEDGAPGHPAVAWTSTMWPVYSNGGISAVMIQVTETARNHGPIVEMNQALVLGALKQHELIEAAHTLNARLQKEIAARQHIARDLAEKARLLDLTHDAIIVRGLDGRITLWNKGAERLYGWSSAEVLGKDLHVLLQSEFNRPIAEIEEVLARTGQYSSEVIQVTRAGHRLPSLCRWVQDPGSEWVLTSYTDITAGKLAEEELTRVRDRAIAASKAKDHFLAALSHELRTPLTPVLMLAEDCSTDPTMPLAAREVFATIVKNVKLEARLIDDLLDVTRIINGKLALDFHLVDIHVALRDAIKIVRPELAEKNLRLRLSDSVVPTVVRGDPVRLQQIFWNVLRNAVKFSPAGGEIRVETAALVEGRVSVKIIDTGIGITPAELSRLFAVFSQGDHASNGGSHRFGGLGLGLSISRMLVEQHGGSIRAESEGADRGATFTIELPLASEPAEEKSEPEDPAPPRPRQKPGSATAAPIARILLVDDHAPTLRALEQLLQRRHHHVVGTTSIADALVQAQQQAFDLLITDIGLPDGSGYDLMKHLRTQRGLRGIALTGYGGDNDLQRSRDAGFTDHLTKPITIQALDLALARMGFA